MKIGKLNKRIEIQDATEAADAYGAPVRTWSTLYEVWASIVPATGRESLIARQVQATVPVEIHIRYRPDITPKHRAKYGSRIFNIGSVIDVDENGEELILSCTEAV